MVRRRDRERKVPGSNPDRTIVTLGKIFTTYFLLVVPFTSNVNLKNCQLDVFLKDYYVPCLSSMLVAVGAKLIRPYGGLQVDG